MSDVERQPSVGSLSWARAVSASEIFAERAAVRQHLRDLRDQQQWADVIELARLSEMPMARGSRWGSWEEVLREALNAARRSGDASAEAWALHQLGTRAMLRDDLATARPILHEALAKREAIGEADAALVTRHNLDLLPHALSGVMTLLTFFVGLVALAIPTFEPAPEEAATPFLDITNEVIAVSADGVGPSVELINRGNVVLSGLKLEPADMFTAESRARCDEIEVGGEPCDLDLDSSYAFAFPQVVCIRFGVDELECRIDPDLADAGVAIVPAGDDAILVTAELDDDA